MSRTKYDVISQNCAYAYFGSSKESPLSNSNVVTDLSSILHRQGVGSPSTSQEDVDRFQQACSRRRVSLQGRIPDTTIWKVSNLPDILSNVEAEENYILRWIFSDKATFYVTRDGKSSQCKIWGSEDHYAIREIERDKCLVDFVMLGKSGTFFLCRKVTARIYLDMLQLYLLPH
jgi:hypothetical protein